MRVLAPCVAIIGLAACGAPLPTWHQDVRPIVEGRGTIGHAEGASAPLALTSYASAKTSGVPYLRTPSLKDAQKAGIAKWVDTAIAQAADPRCKLGRELRPREVRGERLVIAGAMSARATGFERAT